MENSEATTEETLRADGHAMDHTSKGVILVPSVMAPDRSAVIAEAAKTKIHTPNFQVNSEMIQSVPTDQQASELKDLGLSVFDQDQFEMGVMAQVDEAMARQEKERTQKRLEKEMNAVNEDIRKVDEELSNIDKLIHSLLERGRGDDFTLSVRKQKDDKLRQLKTLYAKEKSLKRKLSGTADNLDVDDELHRGSGPERSMNGALGLTRDGKTPKESEEERLIRLGEMTPFGSVVRKKQPQPSTSKLSDFELFLQNQDKQPVRRKSSSKTKRAKSTTYVKSPLSPVVEQTTETVGEENFFDSTKPVRARGESDVGDEGVSRVKFQRLEHNFKSDPELSPAEESGEEYRPAKEDWLTSSDEDCRRVADESSDEEMAKLRKKIKTNRETRTKSKASKRRPKDDGSLDAYKKRLSAHHKERLKRKHERIVNSEDEESGTSSVEVDDDFRCPGAIWNKLYRYQKTGVRWLWELHSQETGGIVGDEMGLGKTIQIIAFLAALQHSKLRDPGFRYRGLGPVIVVCPTTVMHQWVKEFHKWWPPFRVSVLHSSGSYHGSERNLVYTAYHDAGVLVMSYGSVLVHQELLLDYDWHYVVLDEGHKIRNPDAQITIACKQFRTSHRLILSGSPMQNNLKELWSLFDFVFPGKLGTLPDFMEHFSVPITQGGYANASHVQVQTAYKCACVLRDTISPYLLRRMKADVASNLQLPEKNEQVLFCRLTDRQRDVYKEYLNSKECHSILSGNYMVFPGLITLRKICNHPDLTAASERQLNVLYQDIDGSELKYGYPDRSGKLIVVQSLLRLWHEQKHRVLLFTQGRQMLHILEKFVEEEGYTFMRMDGSTAIGSRQTMVDRFNQDESVFVFILTTRVGGLGVNLVGADRVIIFDPDWNPSTDTQARERAWRIGQTRQVTIYRLLTSGTIEEKIYHRQIFKQFLTNRVLKDPKQRRFFKSNDLHELFTLTDESTTGRHGTETSALFAGTGSDVRVKVKDDDGDDDEEVRQRCPVEARKRPNRFDELRRTKRASDVSDDDDGDADGGCHSNGTTDATTGSKEDKLATMRELARQLSQKIGCRKSPSRDRGTSDNRHGNESRSRNDSGCHSDERKEDRRAKRKSKKKSKGKRRNKDAEVDGEKISHLVKRDDWKAGSPDETRDREKSSKKNKGHDDFVLKSLFKKSGVHSAVQHDRIMDSVDPDYLLVEQEAERVAKDAAKALRLSRSRCRSEVGVPTWTGQSGAAGAPNRPLPRFGKKKTTSTVPASSTTSSSVVEPPSPAPPSGKIFNGASSGFNPNHGEKTTTRTETSTSTKDQANSVSSSSSLLERILKRSQSRLDDESAPGRDTASDRELLDEIRTFVAFQARRDGEASTQEILDVFSSKLPPSESAKFKAMLKEICRFEKREDSGVWILRDEFR